MKRKEEQVVIIPSWMVTVPANRQRTFFSQLLKSKAYLKQHEEEGEGNGKKENKKEEQEKGESE